MSIVKRYAKAIGKAEKEVMKDLETIDKYFLELYKQIVDDIEKIAEKALKNDFMTIRTDVENLMGELKELRNSGIIKRTESIENLDNFIQHLSNYVEVYKEGKEKVFDSRKEVRKYEEFKAFIKSMDNGFKSTIGREIKEEYDMVRNIKERLASSR